MPRITAEQRAQYAHLESKRLDFDVIKDQDDEEDLFFLQQDENFGPGTVIHTYEQFQTKFAAWQDDFEREGFGMYKITVRRTEDFIGSIGINRAAPDTPFAGEPEMNFVRIKSGMQGLGFGKESVGRILDHAFDTLELPKVQAGTGNPIMTRWFDQLGFHITGSCIYHDVPSIYGYVVKEVYLSKREQFVAKK